jgi:hypothetical protein
MNRSKKFRSTPLHALLGAALLGIIVMPMAFANAADGPQATASAKSPAKQIKSLKKRIAALEAGGGTGGATGPAGGDLTGTYPNPQVRDNAITSAKIATDGVGETDIAANSVGTSELTESAVTDAKLGTDAVGSSELKATRAQVSGGVTTQGNTPVTTTVNCDAQEVVVGGGYAYSNPDASDQVQVSAPAQALNQTVTGWTVTGTGNAGDGLFAWAICLDV